jgi:carbamoyl-phosphate synthase small subunit
MKKNKKIRLLCLDFGMKNSLRRELQKFDWEFHEVIFSENFCKEKFESKFDAIVISNGPGDPENYKAAIGWLKKSMAEKTPILGICLGMQLLALAVDASTFKLEFAHRSANQPCINTQDVQGKACITAQNHGYSVDENTLPKDWKVTYRHLQDGSVAGISHVSLPFSGVQFHPEGGPGPQFLSIFEAFFQQVSENFIDSDYP